MSDKDKERRLKRLYTWARDKVEYYFDNKSEWRIEFVRFLYQLADKSDLNVKQGNE